MQKQPKSQKKPNDVTTMEVDLEAHGLLRSCQTELQKILRKKKVTFSQVIRVMFAVTHLQDELINMQLENSPFHDKAEKPLDAMKQEPTEETE